MGSTHRTNATPGPLRVARVVQSPDRHPRLCAPPRGRHAARCVNVVASPRRWWGLHHLCEHPHPPRLHPTGEPSQSGARSAMCLNLCPIKVLAGVAPVRESELELVLRPTSAQRATLRPCHRDVRRMECVAGGEGARCPVLGQLQEIPVRPPPGFFWAPKHSVPLAYTGTGAPAQRYCHLPAGRHPAAATQGVANRVCTHASCLPAGAQARRGRLLAQRSRQQPMPGTSWQQITGPSCTCRAPGGGQRWLHGAVPC
jgi:hypothetical protein